MTDNITLIGAGLVGSLLALFLAKRGYTVDVYERRPDMRRETMSAGRSINLALANRGIYPLQQAGLMSEVAKLLTPMQGRMVHELDGTQTLQPYGQKPEEVVYSVSRAELNSLCLTAAEKTGRVTFHFSQRCQSVDFDNNTVTLINEKNGEAQTKIFTRIIGTDGSTSAVRDAIHQKSSTQLEIVPLGHSYKELTIPPLEPTGGFRIHPNSLHIWPRGNFMLIALPNRDGSFTVTLFMPNEGPISFESIKTVDALIQFFKSQFNDASELIEHLSNAYFDNPTGHLATVRCAPWHYKDQALILGDAAHAVVPFHGQGMNCGFEDISQLDALIDQNEGDWSTIFAETDRLRKSNADAIADMAIENYTEMRDSVRDQRFLLKKAIAFELEQRWPTQFIPRYSMVMFHRLPYAEAQSRGRIQDEILNTLADQCDSIGQCDFSLGEKLIHERLTPITLNPGDMALFALHKQSAQQT